MDMTSEDVSGSGSAGGSRRGKTLEGIRWKFGVPLTENKKKVCNFYDKELWSGVTRFKQYLTHIKGETTACTQVPKEVMEMMN